MTLKNKKSKLKTIKPTRKLYLLSVQNKCLQHIFKRPASQLVTPHLNNYVHGINRGIVTQLIYDNRTGDKIASTISIVRQLKISDINIFDIAWDYVDHFSDIQCTHHEITAKNLACFKEFGFVL